MADLSSVSSGSSALDQLVANYEQTLMGPVTNLQNKVSDLNTKISALSTLKSKLATLAATVKSFALKGTSSPFLTYAVSSSDADVAKATATSYAMEGTHSLKVSQLASNDMLLSSTIDTAADSGLSTGTNYTFSVQVGTSEVRQLSVTLTSTSNKDVMTAIASAINADSTLNQKLSASVVNVDGVHSRLVLSADKSGASSAITSFGGDFQSFLGFNSVDFTGRSGSTSNGAGFAKSGAAADVLNAKFALDGIDMTRESNDIDDALQGVTLTLTAQQAADDAAVSLKIAVDKDTVKKSIQQFITDYNAVASYINSNTAVDAKARTRGTLVDDSTARFLRSSLRQVVGGSVTGVKSGNPNLLSGIGISINVDGTLSLSDSSKLDSILSTDISKVADIFSNSSGGGIAEKLKAQLDRFTSVGGSIELTNSNYRTQIQSMNDRINALQTQITKKGEAYRNSWAQIQVLLQQATMTQTMLSYFLAAG